MERFWMTTRGLEPNELGAWVRYADAQRALDAEREKVKELVANQAEYEKCTDEQITALNQGCLDYEKQIATLQAQLADRDAMILQMGEQAAILAKDGMAAKAQVEALQRERDEAHEQLVTERGRHQELERELLARAAQVNRDTQAAIEAERERVPFLEKKIHNLIAASDIVLKVKADQDVRIAKLQAALDAEREKVKGLEAQCADWERKGRDLCLAHGPLLIEHHDVKRDLTQLQALVRAIYAAPNMNRVYYLIDDYRVTLDATTPAADTSIIGKCEPPSQWDPNAQVRGDIS